MGLLAAVAGLCAGGGILVLVCGLTGFPPPTEPTGRPPARLTMLMRAAADHRRRRRVLASAGVGIAVLLILRWPVAALAATAGAYVLPRMLSGREPQQQITRLEALEQWARRLAEVMGASRGLEQTLADSARIAPDAIQTPVSVLADRLTNRANTEHALRAFAADLNDPVGDLIATALILATKRRGPGTREALRSLADAVAQEIIVRREVEAERASLRTTLLVIVISVAGLSVLFISSTTLAAPYGTPAGQAVLAVVTTLYGAALGWMKRLARLGTGARFLHPDPASATRDTVDAGAS